MKDLLKSIFNKFQSHIVEICHDKTLRDKYVQSPRANAILAKMFEKLKGWGREI